MRSRDNSVLAPIALVVGVVLAGLFLLTHLGIRANAAVFGKDTGVLDIAISLGTLGGATWAVWLLYLRTKHSDETVRLAQKTFLSSERTELAARFAKAVELLESQNEATRVGGILMLRDVARGDADSYRLTIQDILQTFIERACQPEREKLDYYSGPPDLMTASDEAIEQWSKGEFPDIKPTRSDVIKALEVLGDPSATAFRGQRQPLIISGLVLHAVSLERIDLSYAVFRNCHFVRAQFDMCELSSAYMPGTLHRTLTFTDCGITNATISSQSSQVLKLPGASVSIWNSDLGSATVVAEQLLITRSDISGLHAVSEKLIEGKCWYRIEGPTLAVKGIDVATTAFDATSLQHVAQTERGMRIYRKAKAA